MESCVPPGFRFHPTDEELVGYYLKKKVASQKIDLDVIREIDLYRIEPWDLLDRCRIGYEEQSEWYFFSHKDKKYPTGTRTNRATMAGFWKATGRDKAIFDKTKLIGLRKTLVFYQGRAPNGQKTDWIMHEYRLESDENAPPQEEGWVVCRAFKKKTKAQSDNSKSIEGWDVSSNYLYEGEAMNTSYLQRSFFCKQEFDGQNNNNTKQKNLNPLIQSDDDSFLQLPQLESPHLPLLKRPVHDNNNNNDPEEEAVEKVRDWRALDKFVASQLSQDSNKQEEGDGEAIGSIVDYHQQELSNGSADMALLMLQGSNLIQGEGEDKYISVFLGSTSETQLGICIFDK